MPKITFQITPQKIIACVFLLAIGASGVIALRHKPSQTKPALIESASNYNCSGDQETLRRCLYQQYKTITQQQGASVAFVKLKSTYNSDPNVRTYCHQITHVIGRAQADMVNDVAEAYSQGDNFCWSGYYHGVIESIVVKIGAKDLLAKLPTICSSIKAQKPYSFYHYNCVHGLGHGIMDVKDSELFDSLKVCDTLTEDWEGQSCYGGVFMENEMDEVNSNHTTTYLKTDQPMYPCTAVAEQYKYQCYLMQTSHALRLANYNFSQVFSECATVESKYVDICYQSLGRDASGNSSSNVEQTKDTCLLGQNQAARTNCIIGAVKDFISYYHGIQQANNLCIALDNSLQTICQTTKTQYYSSF